jgi:hypothetical protein
MHYTTHTIDGTVINTAETAQLIYGAVCNHTAEGRKPAIGYTFDNTPGYVHPYTTWRRADVSNMFVGTPWKTFSEVCEALKRKD